MRLLFLILLVITLSVFLGEILMMERDSYVLFVTTDGQMQINLLFFLGVVCLVILAIYMFVTLLFRVKNISKSVQRWRYQKLQTYIQNHLQRGISHFITEDYPAAESCFAKVAKKSGLQDYYLYAALAANYAGVFERSKYYLSLVQQRGADIDLAVATLQVKLLQMLGQNEKVTSELESLVQAYPKQGHVQELLLKQYIQNNDWHQALLCLNKLFRQKHYSRKVYLEERLNIYRCVLKHASENEFSILKSAWDEIPKNLRQDQELLRIYVEHALRFAEVDKTDLELLLRQALKKKMDDKLVYLYGLVTGQSAKKQLSFAEQLVKKHPDNVALLGTIAKLCIKNELWGKAKHYLELSLKISETPEAYYMMGELCRLGVDHEQAKQYYEKGLQLALRNP